MNERIEELRKALGLTMEKFGERLGVGKTTISNIKNGGNVTGQMEKSICREFGVNPVWLETGEGDMFLELSEDDEIMALVYDVLSDKEDPVFQSIFSILKTYRQLNPENRNVLRNFLLQVVENMPKKENRVSSSLSKDGTPDEI